MVICLCPGCLAEFGIEWMMHCCRNFSELIDVALVYASFIAMHAIFTGILKKKN